MRFFLIISIVFGSLFLPKRLEGQESTSVKTGSILLSRLQILNQNRDYQKVVQYGDTLLENSTTYDIPLNIYVKLFSELSIAHYALDDYDASIDWDNRALEYLLKYDPVDTLELIRLYDNLTASLIQTGRYEDALTKVKTALNIYQSGFQSDLYRGSLTNKWATILFHLGSYDECLNKLNECQEIYKFSTEDIIENQAILYQGYSAYYKRMSVFEKAYTYDSLALEIYVELKDPTDPKMADTYNRLGLSLEELGRLKDAKAYYNKALKILLQDSFEWVKKARTYENLAYVEYKKGDFGSSIGFFNYVIDIRERKLGVNHPRTLSAASMKGLCFYNLKDYKSAQHQYNSTLNGMRKVYPERHTSVARMLIRIGVLYQEMSEYSKALLCLDEAEEIFIHNYGRDNNNLTYVYANKATTYRAMGELKSALNFHKQAIKLYLKVLEKGNPRITTAYTQQAQSLLEDNQEEAALLAVDNGLENLGYYFGDSDPRAILHTPTFLEALSKKAQIHYHIYESDSVQVHLHKAIAIGRQALDLFYFLRGQIQDYDSQVQLRKSYHSTFEVLLAAYVSQYTDEPQDEILEEVFSIMELSKNYDLFLDYSKQMAGREYPIDKDLVLKEAKIREKLSDVKRRQEAGVGETRMIREAIINYQKELEQLENVLFEKFPKYYDARYNMKVATSKKVRSQLSDDTAILSYFRGADHLYIAVIKQQLYYIEKVELPGNLDSILNKFINGVDLSQMTSKSVKDFKKSSQDYYFASRELFDLWIKPVSPHIEGIKKLIVIPSDDMATIPFELLIRKDSKSIDDFKLHDYLIRHYDIVYQFSTSFNKPKAEVNNIKTVLAFAPQYNSFDFDSKKEGSSLMPLAYAEEEVERIKKVCATKAMFGREATIQNFNHLAAQYNVLHVVAHGSANAHSGELSFIAFPSNSNSQNKLYVADVYPMSISNDLVVLSACETSRGEVHKGEGVLSLARGFTFAGARNLITSLWRVNDQSSAVLFEKFYSKLLQKESGPSALRQAKLNFLDNALTSFEAHPYYWGGFIYTGHYETIDLDKPRNVWSFLVLIITCLLTFLIFLKFLFKKS